MAHRFASLASNGKKCLEGGQCRKTHVEAATCGCQALNIPSRSALNRANLKQLNPSTSGAAWRPSWTRDAAHGVNLHGNSCKEAPPSLTT